MNWKNNQIINPPTQFDIFNSSKKVDNPVAFRCNYNDLCFPGGNFDAKKCGNITNKTYCEICKTNPKQSVTCISQKDLDNQKSHAICETGCTWTPDETWSKDNTSVICAYKGVDISSCKDQSQQGSKTCTESPKDPTGGNRKFKQGIYLNPTKNPENISLPPPNPDSATHSTCNSCLEAGEILNKESISEKEGNKCCTGQPQQGYMYSCPRYIVGSTQMQEAVQNDLSIGVSEGGIDNSLKDQVVYAVVGHDSDSAFSQLTTLKKLPKLDEPGYPQGTQWRC